MAWLGTDALPIVAGWGGPPQLHAPEIGGLVGKILENRRSQQEFTQKNIADAIKQYQQQRESSAYTEALQKAGLLPEGDYGGLGIKGGESLADMIMRQKAEQALEAHRAGLLGVAQQRVGRGGGGGGEDDQDYQFTKTDPNTGLVYVPAAKGGWKLGPEWMQPKRAPQKTADQEVARPAYQAAQEAQTEAERRKKILEERFGAPQEGVLPATGFGEERKAKAQAKYLKWLQEQATAQKTQSDLAKKYPGLTTPPADQGTGGTSGGGVTSGGTTLASPDDIKRARARQALDDPEATEEEKRQATIILSQ